MLKEMPGRDVCESSPLFLPRPLPHQLPVIFQQQDEAMVWVTVKQATELTGKSRSSLYRDMARGRVSFRRGVNGHRVIDTCELIRMYGKLRLVGGFRQDGLRLSGVPEGMSSQALFAEIRSLRDEVVVLRQEVLFFTIILNSTKKINCHGVIYVLGGGRFFDGGIEYYIKGGEGHVKVAGKVAASQSIKIVSRVIYFSVTQQGEQFLMTSTKVIKTKTDNVDDAELGVVLPSFYIFKGVQFSVNIKDLTNGKMFYTSRLPSLYVSIR